jgi:hypothetical protein
VAKVFFDFRSSVTCLCILLFGFFSLNLHILCVAALLLAVMLLLMGKVFYCAGDYRGQGCGHSC